MPDASAPRGDGEPRLTDDQLDILREYGDIYRVEAGELLFEEGDTSYNFFVILDGTIDIYGSTEPEHRFVTIRGRGAFLGDVGVLTGQTVFLTAKVREAGRVLEVPGPSLRRVVAEQPELSDLILRTFVSRREIFNDGAGAILKIIGSPFSPATLELRAFAARSQLPHVWIDLEHDADAEELVRELHIDPEETPVVIWRGHDVMRNPSIAELARRVGLGGPTIPHRVFDLVVVGAGPAGLAGAVNAASEGLRTLCLDQSAPGGQASASTRIENYPGFPAGISGAELARRTELQAQKFGAQISTPHRVRGLARKHGYYALEVDGADEVLARSILLAMGATYRKLRLENLARFEGAGIYYAATETEAQMFRGETVVVVGGGNSAGQAAMFLSRRADRVLLLCRGADLTAHMSRYLVSRIEHCDGIEVHNHTIVRTLHGGERLEAVAIDDLETGESRRIATRGLFVFIGAEPRTGWLPSTLTLDDDGFILTGPDIPSDPAREHGASPGLDRPPLLLETNWPGVFAAGDVRSHSTKRIASAVGEGSIAVSFIHRYLTER